MHTIGRSCSLTRMQHRSLVSFTLTFVAVFTLVACSENKPAGTVDSGTTIDTGTTARETGIPPDSTTVVVDTRIVGETSVQPTDAGTDQPATADVRPVTGRDGEVVRTCGASGLPSTAFPRCSAETAARINVCTSAECELPLLQGDTTPAANVPGFGPVSCYLCVSAEVTECLRNACPAESHGLDCCLKDNRCITGAGGIDTTCASTHCSAQNDAYERCATCRPPPGDAGGEWTCGDGMRAGCAVGKSTSHSPRCFPRTDAGR